jgi:hypothetical protein
MSFGVVVAGGFWEMVWVNFSRLVGGLEDVFKMVNVNRKRGSSAQFSVDCVTSVCRFLFVIKTTSDLTEPPKLPETDSTLFKTLHHPNSLQGRSTT